MPEINPALSLASSPSSLSSLSNDDLEMAVAELSVQLDVAEHRLLTLVRELERRERYRHHGLPSTAAWLGWRTGLGTVAAREKVRVARALGELPIIDEAFAKGLVSYSKVRAMTRIATPENEAKLVHMAKHATAAQLERICRGVETVTATSEAGCERWLRVAPDTDGMVRLEVRLHADEAALVMKAVQLARDSAEAQSAPDALVAVAESFIAGGCSEPRTGGDRQQILVCVKQDELMPTGLRAETEVSVVAPETLRRMACDASVTPVTVDDQGTPLDVGRKTRTVPPAIRRALHVRDRTCRFPGCTNHRWLDAHHIEHWAEGGVTSRDNLLLLCTAHHQLVHEGGFRVEGTGADVVFLRPDGAPITAPRVSACALTLAVRPPRPPSSGPPNYHWAIGALIPRRAA
ncbi:MAG: DUF222 domain-containing protein [Myxococcota bacterium]